MGHLGAERGRWLLLIHQLPPKPAYLRVKIRRRLHKVGAQLLKNSVYVLPNGAEALEDFHWLRREILDAGGEATVTAAEFVEGQSDTELEAQFRSASGREYRGLIADARRLTEKAPIADRELARLRARMSDAVGRDYFHADARAEAARLLETLGEIPERASEEAPPSQAPIAAVWVTRAGVQVDRMASAWLIRRFIDPAARLKFVPATGYEPQPGELRYDMFDGEFSHEADRCTFQTLLRRFSLLDPGLEAIGEIVRDIDLKVDPGRRAETQGLRALMRGIALAHPRDEDRIDAAAAAFDGLYAHFARD